MVVNARMVKYAPLSSAFRLAAPAAVSRFSLLAVVVLPEHLFRWFDRALGELKGCPQFSQVIIFSGTRGAITMRSLQGAYRGLGRQVQVQFAKPRLNSSRLAALSGEFSHGSDALSCSPF